MSRGSLFSIRARFSSARYRSSCRSSVPRSSSRSSRPRRPLISRVSSDLSASRNESRTLAYRLLRRISSKSLLVISSRSCAVDAACSSRCRSLWSWRSGSLHTNPGPSKAPTRNAATGHHARNLVRLPFSHVGHGSQQSPGNRPEGEGGRNRPPRLPHQRWVHGTDDPECGCKWLQQCLVQPDFVPTLPVAAITAASHRARPSDTRSLFEQGLPLHPCPPLHAAAACRLALSSREKKTKPITSKLRPLPPLACSSA
jgi:hypothetical protein